MISLPVVTIAAIVAFAIGSVPGAHLVERLWRFDLSETGSGNTGAGNATRIGGIKAGVSLAVLDGLKGLLPVLAVGWLGYPDALKAVVGVSVIAGNNWPVWRSDRGGRGLAASVGVMVGTAPALVIWPGVWSMIGWRIGGGPAGFLGWGLLPFYALAVDAPSHVIWMTTGLALMMAVRRAQGNAGFVAEHALVRVFADDDPRATTDPHRVHIRGGMAWMLVLLVLGPPLYVWAFGSLGGTIEFTSAVIGLLVGAFVVEFTAKWCFGELFREGVEQSGQSVSPGGAFRAALVATGVARLIPAGGAVVPVAMAWSVGNESEGTSGAAVRATVLNYGGLSFAAGAGLLWVSLTGSDLPQAAMATAVGGGLALFGLAMVGFGSKLGILIRLVPRRFKDRLSEVLVDHQLTTKSVGLLASRVVLEAGTLWFTMTAFGVDLGIAEVLATFGLAQLIGGLPGLPGGLGITEAGLVGVLAFFGLPATVTAGPVLVFRIMSYWLPAIGGAIAGGSRFVESRQSGSVDGSRSVTA